MVDKNIAKQWENLRGLRERLEDEKEKKILKIIQWLINYWFNSVKLTLHSTKTRTEIS